MPEPHELDAWGRPAGVSNYADLLPAAILQEIPGCPGSARGTAAIIRVGDDAARLNDGAILVARSADPGWAPLLPRVRGMVLATGGVFSHGVIVVREYGIPVVAGVKEATNRIANGQLIAIDGTQGEIRLLAPEHETRDP